MRPPLPFGGACRRASAAYAVALRLARGCHRVPEGMTLHEAAGSGHVRATRAFLGRGDNVDARDDDGLRPLHFAAREGQADTAAVLRRFVEADEDAQTGSAPAQEP